MTSILIPILLIAIGFVGGYYLATLHYLNDREDE